MTVFSPHYFVLSAVLLLTAFALLCVVMVIGMFKKRHMKAAGWFRNVGFSLEASDRDEPPDKD